MYMAKHSTRKAEDTQELGPALPKEGLEPGLRNKIIHFSNEILVHSHFHVWLLAFDSKG